MTDLATAPAPTRHTPVLQPGAGDGPSGWGSVRNVQEGSRTPWGTADHVRHPADGIVVVSTPGHGGVKLSPERNRAINRALRTSSGWYEEDCESLIVGWYFPEAFPHLEPGYDFESGVKAWFPDGWEAATGRRLAPGESSTRDRALWELMHAERWAVTSAITARHHGVDTGYVEVTVRRVDVGDHLDDRTYLVPKDDYGNHNANVVHDRSDEHGRRFFEPYGCYPGRWLLPVDHDYVDITPPPPPPPEPDPVTHDVDLTRGTERQQALVRRDLESRWRLDGGQVRTLAQLIETNGVARKMVDDHGAGRRTYYLSIPSGNGTSYGCKVTKATFDAITPPTSD